MFKPVIRFGFVFLSLAILGACSTLQGVTPPAPNIPLTPTIFATNIYSPTSVITASPTIFTHQVISTPTTIKPEIQVVAPKMREVDLANLGLSKSTRLILYYEPSNSLRIMSAEDIRPKKIPNIDPEARFSRSNLRHISPDQKWFTYYTFNEVIDNQVYYDYWISSIDGKDQWIFVPRVSNSIYVEWITNDKIELWDYQSRLNCPKRVAILNPFSGETTVPPEAPSSPIPHCVLPLSTNPDRSKMIYLEEGTGKWSIFEFNNGSKQSIFPWLSQSDAYKLTPRYIQWLPSGITYALPNNESIDFAVDLEPSSASDMNSSWNKMLLPSPNRILDNWFSWWSLDDGLIGFDAVETDPSYLDNQEASPLSNFVIVDLRHSVYYDYKLDRAASGERQKVSDYFISASADLRFLAWTIYEPPDMSHPSETVILERETGRIARIKGFEFFGWGEVVEP